MTARGASPSSKLSQSQHTPKASHPYWLASPIHTSKLTMDTHPHISVSWGLLRNFTRAQRTRPPRLFPWYAASMPNTNPPTTIAMRILTHRCIGCNRTMHTDLMDADAMLPVGTGTSPVNRTTMLERFRVAAASDVIRDPVDGTLVLDCTDPTSCLSPARPVIVPDMLPPTAMSLP
jgi:hypothetical protein